MTSVYVQGRLTTASTTKKAQAIRAAVSPLYDLTAETVHLTLANERLEVRYAAKDQASATTAFIREGAWARGPGFQCAKFDEGPGLQLWPFISYEDFVLPVPVGVLGGSNTSVVLYKAVDGSLVVRLQAESGFAILLVPYLRTDSDWLRFGMAGQAADGPKQPETPGSIDSPKQGQAPTRT